MKPPSKQNSWNSIWTSYLPNFSIKSFFACTDSPALLAVQANCGCGVSSFLRSLHAIETHRVDKLRVDFDPIPQPRFPNR